MFRQGKNVNPIKKGDVAIAWICLRLEDIQNILLKVVKNDDSPTKYSTIR